MVFARGWAVLTRWYHRVALAAVFALLGVQAVVVALAIAAPRTTAAYRATYLDHSADCWRPNLDMPPDIGAGDVIVPRLLRSADACALLPKGWNPPDTWGVWSNGPLARIDIPLRPDDRRVSLRLRGYSSKQSQTVAWSVSAGRSGILDIPMGLVVPLTLSVQPGQGMLHLTLGIQHVHAPLDADVADWRAIGVALIDITRQAGSHDTLMGR